VTVTEEQSSGQLSLGVTAELTELELLHDFDDHPALNALAEAFEQRDYEPGTTIVDAGTPLDTLILIAVETGRS
jgi:hypothetical protein